jgi:hypothetical protein
VSAAGRWQAAAAVASAVAAILLPLLAGGWRALLVGALSGLVLVVGGLSLALAGRGSARFGGAFVAVLAQILLVALGIAAGLLWAMLASAALFLVAVLTGRAAARSFIRRG